MKKISGVLIFCLCLWGTAFSQWSLKLSPMIQSGDYYPYVLKTGWGAEINESIHLNDYYRPGVFIGFYSFKATQDTFADYVVGGLNPVLSPGWEVLHHYYILQGGMSNSFVLLPDKDISPVIGLDLGFNFFDIDEAYQNVVESSQGGGDFYYNWVIIPHVAVQYRYEKWIFQVGFARSIGFGGMIGSQAFWQPFISIGIGEESKHYHHSKS